MVDENNSIERPSREVQDTSKETAFYRSFSNIPNALTVAGLVGAREDFFKVWRNFELIRGIIPSFESRYKAIDYLLNESKVPQVVEVAAGRTTRGLNNPQWNYIHTDQDTTALNEMEKVAESLIGLGKGVVLPPLIKFDVLSGEGVEEVMQYLTQEPVGFTHEGLFRYYPHESKGKTMNMARLFLQKYGGVYITPDVASKERMEELRKLRPDTDRVTQIQSQATGRDLHSFLFEKDEDFIDFGNEHGFKVKLYDQGDFVTHLTSAQILYPNKTLRTGIEDSTKRMKIAELTLA